MLKQVIDNHSITSNQSPANDSNPTSVTKPLIDRDQVEKYISILAKYNHTGTGIELIRTFDDNQDRKDGRLCGYLRSNDANLLDEIQKRQDAGAGVFANVNITKGKAGRKNDIVGIRAVIIESDEHGLVDTPLEPHLVIESSPNKYHYYFFTESISEGVRAALQRVMVDTHHSDPNAQDVSRVLRVAGTYHQKVSSKKGLTGDKFMVRIIEDNSDNPAYTQEQLTAAFNPDITPPKPTHHKVTNNPDHPKVLNELERKELAVRIASALGHVDLTERHDWIDMGHALKYSCSIGDLLNDQAYELWNEASSEYDDYDSVDQQRTWDTMKPNGEITLGSLFYQAKQNGWIDPVKSNLEEHGATTEIYNSLAGLVGIDTSSLRQRELLFDETVKRVFNNSWYNPGTNKIFILNEQYEIVANTPTDAIKAIPRAYSNICDPNVMNELIEEFFDGKEVTAAHRSAFIKKLTNRPVDIIIERLKYYNQRKQIEYTVDPFIESGYVEMRTNKVRVTFPMRRITYSLSNVDSALKSEVISDYLEHFKSLPYFLDFIVAARFAPDRKNASLWLHATSDWGKNFLVDVFKKLGLIVELSAKELEKMFDGSPVGRTPEEFIHACITVFDEVKTIKAESKQISNRALLSAKFESTCAVDIYAKIYLSAEMIQSLAGDQGVEGQFANRICYLKQEGSIKERQVFKRVGNGSYHEIITEYIAQEYQKRVDDYIGRGRGEAARLATLKLDEFHFQFNLLDTFYSIDDVITDVSDQIRELIIFYADSVRDDEYHNWCAKTKCSKSVLDQLRNLVVFSKIDPDTGKPLDQQIVLKSPTKFIETYIDSVASFSGKVSLSYKSSVIAEHLGKPGRHRIKTDLYETTQYRGILINQDGV